jgi:hypothetical protein
MTSLPARQVRLDQGYTPAAVQRHLDRQRDVLPGYVKLDTGAIVRVGSETLDDCDDDDD